MTPEQTILTAARESGSITTARVKQLICGHLPELRRNYYAARTLGHMVKFGKLVRVKPGIYALPSPRLAEAGAQNCGREASI